MAAALQRLDVAAGVSVEAVSSVYRTPPWGKTDQPDFLNAAAELRTGLSPRELLDLCLAAERKLKRVRAERWGPRLIDIDILLFGSREIHESGLDIPHPRITERAFVLVPLSEIAPSLVLDRVGLGEWLVGLDTDGIEKLPGSTDWWKAI